MYLQYLQYLSKVQAETMAGFGEKTVLEVATSAQRMLRSFLHLISFFVDKIE